MPFFLWLRFITMQKLLVLHRRHLGAQKRDARRDISIDRSTTPAASSAVLAAQLVARQSTPSHAAQRAESKIELQRALDSMDPIDQEVLVLRHFEELTNSDAAQVLDISPTAANNRYMRALKRLKEILMKRPGLGKDLA
jgi:RNA polymerase sigma-70 factor (ECF subfamily)